ncbi:MAG: family 16 glycosylhydrolase [Chloroflexota bacterium]
MSVPCNFHAASKELGNYIIALQYAKPYNQLVFQPEFKPTTTKQGAVSELAADAWRLSIPAGPAGAYRLAQLDDYAGLARKQFPWKPPLTLSLQARASSALIPGTWGFGLWNDPFSLSLGFSGGQRKLPALPQATWFFFASNQNHLSLQDDLPANGLLAATFRSLQLPALILALGAPILPMLAWPPSAKIVRRLLRKFIQQDAASPPLSPTQWHTYSLDWNNEQITFMIDGDTIHQTAVTPLAPLGVVIWIDNQYAAFPPDGRIAYGTLESQQSHWIEIKSLSVESVA